MTGAVTVLAGRHDRLYPHKHGELLKVLLENGATVSEMPFTWEPRAQRPAPHPADLPTGTRRGHRRGAPAHGSPRGWPANRAAKSSLRPRIRSTRARKGTNGPTTQGATLITSTADVIAALEPILGHALPPPRIREPEPSTPGSEPGDDKRARTVSLLGPTPIAVGDLVRPTGAMLGIMRFILLELEIASRLGRHGGNLMSLV